MRAWKEELMTQRRLTIERKMQRAEEKRQHQIKQIVRKAHEEETKVIISMPCHIILCAPMITCLRFTPKNLLFEGNKRNLVLDGY